MNANQKDTQARKYQLTINNPAEKALTHEVIKAQLQQCKSLVYFCMSDEVGENGTPHTHIYAAFSAPVRFSTIKNLFPAAHIENAYGTSAQNRAYILKEGEEYADKAETSIEGSFEEWGELPAEVGQGARSDLDLMYNLIKEGATTNAIIAINPELIKYINQIERVRQILLEDENKDEFRALTITYIQGKTGTGKTRFVMEKHGYSSVYRVTDYKNHFDSYKGENVILFDEFNSSIRIQDMLNYLDGYPLELPCRYANKRALYTVVYLVSNIPLEMQYQYIQGELREVWRAFLRRINYVMEFRGKGEFTQRELNSLENIESDYPEFYDNERNDNV